jgi:hypothetical protein
MAATAGLSLTLDPITDISPRKNTDQGDFLLKRAVRAVVYS